MRAAQRALNAKQIPMEVYVMSSMEGAREGVRCLEGVRGFLEGILGCLECKWFKEIQSCLNDKKTKRIPYTIQH